MNHNRLSSHYAYLLYLLLLRIEQNVNNDKMPKFILQNLYDKCLRDKYILHYILEQSCQTIEPIDNSMKIDHFQLLLIQLATSLNKSNIPLPLNGIITNIDIDFIHLIIDITGLALLLLSQDVTTNQSELSTEPQRILPTSMKSCLGYWMSYLAMFHSSSCLMNDTMKILLNECSRLCSLWIKELIVCSPEEDVTIQANNNTVYLLHVNYPYARLRGLVHILASITFSNLDNSSNSSLITNESITPNSEGNDNDKQPVDVQSSSSILSLHQKSNEPSEQNMPITQEYANELLKILCGILVITHYATHKFEEFYNFPDSIEDNLPFNNDLVKNKHFTVYPSKLAKKMVLLSTRSPFSLIQAICFKQDVIRCIVGLITQFPQLSLSLALHKFDADNYMVGDDDVSEKLINSTTPTPSFLSTFEVILDATNRDPFNSFCVEWAILLIRLLVKSNQPHSSQVMSILSSKLNGLNILND
uniref:LINES_N domain-containing protein n=1 Tax=Schistosoma mansoni TaxID=6183 RepID=A0A5K4F0S7_SCHMA